MHTREKSLREEKSRTNSKNPSFSSTLLDEIYRSIDKNEGENKGQKAEKIGKKYSNGVGEKKKKQVEDEEINRLRRACLIEKWMEKKVEEKIFIRKPPLIPDFEKDLLLQDNDPLFFSSTSISSVSSSGVLSSSDTEYFAAVEKNKKSCFFGSSFPKPIKTKVSVSSQKVSLPPPPPPPPQPETEDSMKSRLDALKIYANLKNLKQPISPGARLTSFINSLFTNGCSKNSKSRKSATASCKHSEEKSGHSKMERKSKSTQTSSTCSSTTSLARLRLSKFPIPPPKTTLSKEMNLDDLKVEKRSDPDDEEGDARSDCSSELFEIDDLVLFGKKRVCEELPVYETTDLGMNRAIARGLMR